MALEDDTSRAQYATNGTTGPFTVPFYFLEDSHLLVIHTDDAGVETDLVLTTDYSVSGAGVAAGGSVTTVTAYASGGFVTVVRNVPRTQLTVFRDGDAFPSSAMQNGLDKLTMVVQQLYEVADRSLLVPVSNEGALPSLPSAADRADKLLSFDSAGDPVAIAAAAGTATALSIDLASTASGKGDELVGKKRTFSGSVATTLHAWHEAQVIDLLADLEADSTGVTDCTALFQTAITAGSVRVPPGAYTMSWTALGADVSIPANRKIIVEKGATITMTGGRFTAENVENVEWVIDGWVKSVAMRTAASKPLWTGLSGDRGFIEFAEDYVAGSAASGFKVRGTGKVSGDWTGTPNYSDPTNQTNRKGIACWNAKNVLVEGLEVFGFDGEAVYACFFDAASENIVFRNNHVHDTRFNALNFNAGTNGGGCSIHKNRVKNAFAVEISVGSCEDNYVEDTVGMGIWTGVGAGLGPLSIKRNTVIGCGSASDPNGIAAVFASGTPVTGVEICDNTVINSYGYSIYTDYIREFTIRGNRCSGTGQTAGGYDIGVNHALRGSVSENTFTTPGGFAQASRVAVDPATCFDVSVCPDSNVYRATTGSVAPVVGNGVQTIASATALPLPVLGSIFLVSGTTSITSITSALWSTNSAGREITLIFADVLTFTDGSNLKLAGNFVTTADDTITLVCDGTNWFEKCRSVN